MSFQESVTQVGAVEVTWMGVRPSDWFLHHFHDDVPFGLTGVMFEVRAGRAGWLARLESSDWFADVVPRSEDLANGRESSGHWTAPPGVEEEGVAAFLNSGRIPDARWWATVAVDLGAGPAHRRAVLGLVEALRRRRSEAGDALPVVVTLEGLPQHDTHFVAQLRKRGAFVICPGRDVGSDHLHHFPVRALAAEPRLICVDLFDVLSLWRPGGIATLHRVPNDPDEAARAMDAISVAPGGARALDLRFHFRPDLDDVQLDADSDLAERCTTRLVADDGDYIWSNDRRLDGASGTIDLLVID